MASLDAHDAALLEQEEHDLDPPGPFPAAAAAEAAGASHSSETVTDPGAAGPSEATASSSDERTERTERMASIELIEKEMGEVSLENFEELLGEKLKKVCLREGGGREGGSGTKGRRGVVWVLERSNLSRATAREALCASSKLPQTR